MKNRPRRDYFCIFLLLLLFAVVRTSAAQNQYYISPTGSDSNDGSRAHPWATFNHASSAARVGLPGVCTAASGWISASGIGACIHVAPGVYSESIVTKNGGIASARVRYVSDTQYAAILTGSASNSIIWSNYAQYIDVIGFDFDGSRTAVLLGLINHYDSASYACHNLISANRGHNIANSGGAINGPGEFGTSGTNLNVTRPCGNTYQGNLFYHNNGGGTSTFYSGNADAAIETGWGDIVQDNIVMDQGGGQCLSLTHTSTHLIVTHNTLLNCAQGGMIIANAMGILNDYSTFTNNIIANTGSVGNSPGIRVYKTGGCGLHNIYANNLMYGNAGKNYVFDSPCSNTSTATLSGSNSTTFVNYTGTIAGDYHLKSGSSAVGAGTTSCALSGCVPPLDFSGSTRLLPPDIGSYAFAAAHAPTAPATLATSVH